MVQMRKLMTRYCADATEGSAPSSRRSDHILRVNNLMLHTFQSARRSTSETLCFTVERGQPAMPCVNERLEFRKAMAGRGKEHVSLLRRLSRCCSPGVFLDRVVEHVAEQWPKPKKKE